MTTRAELKAELDRVDDENLDVLYRLVLSLPVPAESPEPRESWTDFVAASYGSLADAPIRRGEQGTFEVRDPLR